MTYLDAHPLRAAFAANTLVQLADLISAQGEAMLREAGLDVPARAVSILLMIGERGEMSAADIAGQLQQPHQLVTQRADLLVDLGLIARRSDPGDGRRKILVLTDRGADQFERLTARLARVADVFAALFVEIDCDLAAMARRAIAALDRSPILERLNAGQPAATAAPRPVSEGQ
ncbi:MarR family transcriptional regulator [uncultured Brevundimonas sp.]|uniref:MarR family winged helix-turn-helix transcriptional regulator n=1 Tax=uncultured Brevundimonas sp. TaxID=213418 RepID=UPI0030EE9F20